MKNLKPACHPQPFANGFLHAGLCIIDGPQRLKEQRKGYLRLPRVSYCFVSEQHQCIGAVDMPTRQGVWGQPQTCWWTSVLPLTYIATTHDTVTKLQLLKLFIKHRHQNIKRIVSLSFQRTLLAMSHKYTTNTHKVHNTEITRHQLLPHDTWLTDLRSNQDMC